MRILRWQAWIEVALFLVFVAGVVALLDGCAPPKNAKEAAAEAGYGAELQLCIDQHATEQGIDACAEDVRRRWGVAQASQADGLAADLEACQAQSETEAEALTCEDTARAKWGQR